jgi:hypothetical protein
MKKFLIAGVLAIALASWFTVGTRRRRGARRNPQTCIFLVASRIYGALVVSGADFRIRPRIGLRGTVRLAGLLCLAPSPARLSPCRV